MLILLVAVLLAWSFWLSSILLWFAGDLIDDFAKPLRVSANLNRHWYGPKHRPLVGVMTALIALYLSLVVFHPPAALVQRTGLEAYAGVLLYCAFTILTFEWGLPLGHKRIPEGSGFSVPAPPVAPGWFSQFLVLSPLSVIVVRGPEY